uniref:DDHD domain containing 1 n=1 Tax=Takifugu rubripes TaxID=31033 RepID=A0A674P782_TAKRU
MSIFNGTKTTLSSSASDGKGSATCVDSANNNTEWEVGSDVFCPEMSPMDDMQAGMSSIQSGLDGHLPLLHAAHHSAQDGLMLDLSSEASFLDGGSLEYSDNDGHNSGPLFERRKRTRSNSSRHHFSDVVTELGPEEVRWFYKEDKKNWKPFVGHDSLTIEIMFRKYCELNCVEAASQGGRGVEESGDNGVESGGLNGAAPPDTGAGGVDGGPGGVDTSAVSLDEGNHDGAGINVDPVCVRGGLYEVDIKERECKPVYWMQQDHIPVMRGQWFIDGSWLPLEEEESDLIEQEHLNHFRGQQIQDTFETDLIVKTVDSKDAIHSLKLSRTHVDWHSVDEVYLYSDATTSKIARTVTQKLGFSKASSSGTRLHRGFVEEASPEDRPPQTTHVVFVVHGIGQKMDQGRIIKNTGMLRECGRKMEEKHFLDHNDEHVEFLPVEWRSKLQLDGDTVDSITPDKVRGLRDLLNSSAMDIMYYNSPLYRDEITKGLTQELNRLYTLFCSRNPEFEERGGKVSIVSHSLGCVITYDIMTGWDPVRKIYYFNPYFCSRDTNIVFSIQVENFFCMGSPLAVFLALRGIRPGSSCHQDHILPTTICSRLFNVFHPTDPVAYRLEPLILKHYSNIAPIQIHWCSASNPTPYDEIRPTYLNPVKDPTSDTESIPSPSTSPVLTRRYYGESITSLGKASILGAASIGKGIGGILFSRFSRSNSQPSVSSGLEGGANVEEEEPKQAESQSAYGLSTITRPTSPTISFSERMLMPLFCLPVELERRIDFELREGLVESRYWSAVTSHTGYWCSHDIALFLLTFIYKQKTNIFPGGL